MSVQCLAIIENCSTFLAGNYKRLSMLDPQVVFQWAHVLVGAVAHHAKVFAVLRSLVKKFGNTGHSCQRRCGNRVADSRLGLD